MIVLPSCPCALATLLSTPCMGAEVPVPHKQKSTITCSQAHQPLTLSPWSDAAIFMLRQFADSQEDLTQELSGECGGPMPAFSTEWALQ